MRRLLVAALVLAACAPKPMREISEGPEVIELDEARYGWPKWISANARFVALYLFADEESAEKWAPEVPPALELFDTVARTRNRIDEIVATDPRGRYAVALAGEHLWLLDGETGAWEDLAARGADLMGDRMRCWGGRQAAFDPHGAELLYLRTNPDRAVVRRLRDGTEREVAAPPHLLWRAEPTEMSGWVRFSVVPRDGDGDGALTFPLPEYACEAWIDYTKCHDCMMTGPRLSGDTMGMILVHDDGARVLHGALAAPSLWNDLPDPYWIPLGGELFGQLGSSRVFDVFGAEVPPPEGCTWSPQEPPAILVDCADGKRLFRPETRDTRPLPGLTALLERPVRDDEGTLWSAASVTVDGREALARVNLDDGTLVVDRGSIGVASRPSETSLDRRGWLSAPGHAMHVPTGRIRRLPAHDVSGHPRLVTRGDQRFTVDLDGGRLLPIGQNPAEIAENGCALLPPHPPEAPSWALVCPPARSLALDLTLAAARRTRSGS